MQANQPDTSPIPEQPIPNVPSEPINPNVPNEDQDLSGNESEANPGELGNNTEVNFDPTGPEVNPGSEPQ